MVVFLSHGFTVSPKRIINTPDALTDFVYNWQTITVSTMKGSVEKYVIKSGKLVGSYKFDKIKDFTGEEVDAEVFHIETAGDLLFALVHGENGKNNIFKLVDNSATLVVPGQLFNSVIVDFYAVDKGKLLIALLSNELVLYDLKNKKNIYRVQVSPYAFSAMDVSHGYVFTADESGEIHKTDIATGKLIKTYKGQHVDNVLCVASDGKTVAGGGKDRRVSFYNETTGSGTHLNTGYFVTALALGGGKAAWFDDSSNAIVVYRISDKKKIVSVTGHKSMVNKLYFAPTGELVSCGSDGKIIIYKF